MNSETPTSKLTKLSLFLDPDILSTYVLLALKVDMVYDKFSEKIKGFT